MSRIRSVKPEFWTSQQVTSCSVFARLLFIGLWNFCDDRGVHPAEPKRLKMEVFPGDAFEEEDITGWIGELIRADLLLEYEADERRFWWVTGWHHQRIDRPSFKYPAPPKDSTSVRRTVAEESPTSPRAIDERHPAEGKGGEGKGEDISTPNGVDVRREAADLPPDPVNGKHHDATPSCPHDRIIALYHEILPMLPRVRVWDRRREGFLRARWREDEKRQAIDWWEKFFRHVAKSDFLTGRAEPIQGRSPFIADLEWLLRPGNFAKVIEGKYDNRRTA